jgi:CubicO group peptidase (beta-lactamase class C family)
VSRELATDWPERVRAAFEENFSRGTEVGAAVAIWKDGAEAFSLCGGWRDAARSLPWEPDTLVLIWSATKGLSAACVLHALEQRGVPLEARVMEFWPEFGRSGKESITVGQVLSHRAGLSALDAKDLSLLDHEGVARAIERQPPLWGEGEGHGYGPRTFGFVADEMVRRLSGGTPLGAYFRTHFAEPLDLDLWIGLPAEHHARVAQMLAARVPACPEPEDAFSEALTDPGSLTRRAFAAPGGVLGASAMNSPAVREASLPSLGGIGSASSLAKFYAVLASGGTWQGAPYLGGRAFDHMTHTLAQGYDKVLHVETAFSAGFMRDPVDGEGKKLRTVFGPSLQAFGHPGAGGSLAFADPETGLGFAYVMNQMEMGALPRRRALALVDALYSG